MVDGKEKPKLRMVPSRYMQSSNARSQSSTSTVAKRPVQPISNIAAARKQPSPVLNSRSSNPAQNQALQKPVATAATTAQKDDIDDDELELLQWMYIVGYSRKMHQERTRLAQEQLDQARAEAAMELDQIFALERQIQVNETMKELEGLLDSQIEMLEDVTRDLPVLKERLLEVGAVLKQDADRLGVDHILIKDNQVTELELAMQVKECNALLRGVVDVEAKIGVTSELASQMESWVRVSRDAKRSLDSSIKLAHEIDIYDTKLRAHELIKRMPLQ